MLLVLLLAQGVEAHTRSESYSHWRQSGQRVTVTVTVPAREVTRLAAIAAQDTSAGDVLADHLRKHTAVYRANGACEQSRVQALQAAAGFTKVELMFHCGEQSPQRIYYRGLFDAAPSHVHYARYYVEGSLHAELLLTDTNYAWDIPRGGSGKPHGFLPFLQLGLEHIAGGLDHIAFLFGLLLVAGTLRNSVVAVTGFTIGHSVSLAAAVLGYVHAEAGLVEAFIGFTVALVAVEYFVLRHKQADLVALGVIPVAWIAGTVALLFERIGTQAVIAYLGIGVFAFCYLMLSRRVPDDRSGSLLFVATAAFGLIHGFGFAGFLLETGIAGASLLKPLLGFNLGVELGQLLLVAAALLLARAVHPLVREPLKQAAAAALCGIGVFWFVGRSIGV
ncbi:MAG: HupE/UreJ family protein [Gammaproteobacteria bacterium]|nr:HupE/UreJ family protein [Gammaproteobacteria bacterium]